MTLNLGDIANIITAVGTIGTLAFLAIQIRDNTRIMQTSALGSMLQNARERIVGHLCDDAEISDIVTRGMNSLDNLDEKERVRFMFFLGDEALHMQHITELFEAKLISRTDHDAWLAWASLILRTPGASALWPQLAQVLAQPISNLLQTHREQNPDAPTMLDIMPVFRRCAVPACTTG